MKTIKYITLISALLSFSLLFASCNDDMHNSPVSNHRTSTDATPIHLRLNLEKRLPLHGLNNTRDFTLGTDNHIKWSSDTWNNTTNKPKVILFTSDISTSKSDRIENVRRLSSNEYTYEPGHKGKDDQEIAPSITINTNINWGTGSKMRAYFVVMDKRNKDDIDDIPGYTSENGVVNAALSTYIDSYGPSGFYHTEKDGYTPLPLGEFVVPNDNIYFNFIFSGYIDKTDYDSGNHSFNIPPLGSLLMIDFSPRKDGDKLPNPAKIEGFRPTLVTNAFRFIGEVLDLRHGYPGLDFAPDYISYQISFKNYDNNSSDYITKSSPSKTYVCYAFNKHGSGTVSISNNGVKIFDSGSSGWSEDYNTKRVSMHLSMTPTSSTATRAVVNPYNALSYVGLYNVKKDDSGNLSFDRYGTIVNKYDAVSMFLNTPLLRDYHLPTLYEWMSIFPYAEPNNEFISFSNPDHVLYGPIKTDTRVSDAYNNNGQRNFYLRIGKSLLSQSTSYYQTCFNSGNPLVFAIRFSNAKEKGSSEITNKFLSIWLYKYEKDTFGNGYMMSVYSYVIPPNSILKTDFADGGLKYDDGTGMKDFKTEDFFTSKLNSGAIYRTFHADGSFYTYNNLNEYRGVGSNGYYWSATDYIPDSTWDNAYNIFFSSSFANTFRSYRHDRYSVRPFVGPNIL